MNEAAAHAEIPCTYMTAGPSIVTVTYNSAEVLADFLTSLISDECYPRVRVYVVDNGSTDDSIAIARSFEQTLDLTVIPNGSNLGAAGGNNTGIVRALADGAQWIFLINNDTVVPAGTLSGLVQTAVTRDIHILSATIEGTEPKNSVWYCGGSIYPYQGMRVRHENIGAPIDTAPSGVRTTPYAPSSCLLIHQRVFRDIGALDEDFFVYFEDVDFAIRAKTAGFDYWVSGEHKIIHKASSLTGGYLSPFTVHSISKNWVVVARKRCNTLQRVSGYAYMQLWMVARVALRRDTWSGFLLRQRAFIEGLKVPLTRHGNYISFE
jgi:GT2 family glycosyltransferase